jgi:hypothetical protein
LNDNAAHKRLDEDAQVMALNEDKRRINNEVIIDSIICDEPKNEPKSNDKEFHFSIEDAEHKSSSDHLSFDCHHVGICIVCDKNTDQNCSESLPCGHVYCNGCIAEWFDRALEDTSLIPLRCCKQRIPDAEYLLKKYLGNSKAEKLLILIEEKDCQYKMYCPNKLCSAFINLERVEEYIGFDLNFECRFCKTEICFNCHYRKHETSISCELSIRLNEEPDIVATETLKQLGYQRCNSCKRFVELVTGCNHMTCTCKHEFCYECGADWIPRRCSCELFDEERVIRDEDRNIPENIVGIQRVNILHQRVQNARGQMFAEENCFHYSMTRNNSYAYRKNKPRCRLCNRRLNLFGYDCIECGMKKCIGCHLNG